jgi:hypothetical protein
MTTLPALSTADARLPETYERAKAALADCNRIDECKDWADKAQALASYARQSDDDSLFTLARRIQARAIRRAGELLKQFDGRPANNPSGRSAPQTDGEVGLGRLTQRDVAERAGMSERQQATAVRVASVSEADFNAAIEAEKPATVTALANMGKTKRAEPERPAGFYEATHFLGALRRLDALTSEHDARLVASGIGAHERDEARSIVHRVDAWLDSFIVAMEHRA